MTRLTNLASGPTIMAGFKNGLAAVARRIRRGTSAPLAVTLALVGAIMLAPAASVQAQTMTREWSGNSIINGGALTSQEFIDKVRANNPDDLQAIYDRYGLTTADYDNFRQNAKLGVAHKNGEITVDGRVVARDARSLGREKKSYSTEKFINRKAYYESRSQDVFNSDTIPVLVMFDGQGRYKFGVLTACANPIRATNVVSASQAPRCDQLQVAPVANQANTYNFTTKATNFGGGAFTRAVYEFSDGTTETRTAGTDVVTHTFANPGTYTVKATAYYKPTNGAEIAVTAAACQTTITVQAPPAPAPIAPTPTPPPAAPVVVPVAQTQPTTLPETGIGEMLGLAAAVSVLGSAGYYIYAKRRLVNI